MVAGLFGEGRGSETYKIIESETEPTSDELAAVYQRYLDIGGDPVQAIRRVIEGAQEREASLGQLASNLTSLE